MVIKMSEETTKLFDSELKVMGVLWNEGDVPCTHSERRCAGGGNK